MLQAPFVLPFLFNCSSFFAMILSNKSLPLSGKFGKKLFLFSFYVYFGSKDSVDRKYVIISTIAPIKISFRKLSKTITEFLYDHFRFFLVIIKFTELTLRSLRTLYILFKKKGIFLFGDIKQLIKTR